MKIALWLGLSALSAVLYWLGGREWGNKLFRRAGCAIISLALFVALRGQFGLNLPILGVYATYLVLNYLALTTYHDYVGFDCWLLTGAGYSLASIPLYWLGVNPWAILGRTVFLSLGIWWLRTRTGNVHKEEAGSGLIYALSMPLLFL